MIEGAWTIFAFGCIGGVLLELLRWWKLRESLDFPRYVRKPVYWLLTILMILAGGVLAIAYGTKATSAVLAMNLGAAAPAIIGALANPPRGPDGREKGFGGGEQSGRLRRFLAFG